MSAHEMPLEDAVPTYQYACTACDERLEVVQKFADDPLTECPVCQGHLRKVFSAVGVVFKGSGFYRTDSRTGSSARSGKDGGGESKSTASTASKPEASTSSASADKASISTTDKSTGKSTTPTGSKVA